MLSLKFRVAIDVLPNRRPLELPHRCQKLRHRHKNRQIRQVGAEKTADGKADSYYLFYSIG